MRHAPDAVFEFLSDLRNHWRLEPHFLELENVGPRGGRVRMGGPLGISRSAQTEVVAAEPPSPVAHLHGRAQMGRTTRGTVHWEIAPSGSGSDVTLTATAERLSALDKALLLLGGGRWFRRVLANGIARLDAVLDERE